jgi:hypothetical protein
VPRIETDGGDRAGASRAFGGAFDLEELRRRNMVSVGMDVLYLVTTGFFAYMASIGWGEYRVPVPGEVLLIPHPGWPSAIAAIPLGTLLFFGRSSSRAFFVSQLLTIAVVVAAALAGVSLV